VLKNEVAWGFGLIVTYATKRTLEFSLQYWFGLDFVLIMPQSEAIKQLVKISDEGEKTRCFLSFELAC
jgi:hypothetical protein